MVNRTSGRQLTKYVPDYVVFDLETTGVSCQMDEVIVKVVSGAVVEEFSTLVNPGIPIPAVASEINGITDDMVRNSPDFKTALDQFLEFIGDSVLVGHNISSFATGNLENSGDV